ncbi:hypothetical protein ADUPG1_014574, partial [Aduncisulcus paluster]
NGDPWDTISEAERLFPRIGEEEEEEEAPNLEAKNIFT